MELKTLFEEALLRVKDIAEKVGQADDAKAQAYVSNQTNKLWQRLEEAKAGLPTDQLDDYNRLLSDLAHQIKRLNIPHHNLHNNIGALLTRYAGRFPALVGLFEKARTLPQIRKAIDAARELVADDPLAVIAFDKLQTEPALFYKVEAASGKDRTPHIVARVQRIEEKALKMEPKQRQAYIHTQCKRLADQEHKHLGWTVDKKTGLLVADEPGRSVNTYMNLMSRYRNAIRALGYKHHALEYHLGRLVSQYSDLYPKLELSKKLAPHLSIKTLRENVVSLKKAPGVVRGCDFHKALNELQIEHYAFYAFASVRLAGELKSKGQKKALEDKLKYQVEINPAWVVGKAEVLIREGMQELQGYLALPAKNRPRQTPYASLAVGLALASGRRMTEIMKTATFTDVKDSTNMVEFGGQLKTKFRYLFEDLKPYKIPVLVDKALFLAGFEVLRKFSRTERVKLRLASGEYEEVKVIARLNEAAHNDAVAQKYASTLNAAVRRLLECPEFTFKDCRAIYAAVGSVLHNPDKVDRLVWAKTYLGHADEESDTAKHYLGFLVDHDVDGLNVIHGARKQSDKDKKQASGGEAADQDFLNHLNQCDERVAANKRAKVWPAVHEWLKDKVAHGLTRAQIYQEVASSNRSTDPAAWLRSYIRKNCLVNGRSLNPATVLEYITGSGLGLTSNLEVPNGGNHG